MPVVLDTAVAVRRAAMDLLARREHGRVELSRKLKRRGAPDELIDTELQRLVEQGLLSEGRYLDSYVASRARSGHGPQRIREELAQRGLSRVDIEQALADCGVDWREQLQQLWLRKFAGQLPSDSREKAKQGRFLLYRGFPMEMVTRLLNARDD